MKLTHIAATLYALGLGRHIDTRPAIASIAAQQHQLRKQQKQFRHNRQSQAKEL